MTNPHQIDHAADEAHFCGDGYTQQKAASVVASEYAGHEDAVKCGACGQPTGYYWASVGAYHCKSCDALEVDGVWAV